jgi:hypothetical protein
MKLFSKERLHNDAQAYRESAFTSVMTPGQGGIMILADLYAVIPEIGFSDSSI